MDTCLTLKDKQSVENIRKRLGIEPVLQFIKSKVIPWQMSRLTAYGEHSVSDCIFKDQTAHTSGDVGSITQAAFTSQITLVPIWAENPV
jgi:hypothetical protein